MLCKRMPPPLCRPETTQIDTPLQHAFKVMAEFPIELATPIRQTVSQEPGGGGGNSGNAQIIVPNPPSLIATTALRFTSSMIFPSTRKARAQALPLMTRTKPMLSKPRDGTITDHVKSAAKTPDINPELTTSGNTINIRRSLTM
jgi:hypothetical protein